MKITAITRRRSSVAPLLLVAFICYGLAGCDQAGNPFDTDDAVGPDTLASGKRGHIKPGRIVQITSDTSDQVSPSIHNDSLVYADNRNGNFDIFAYRLSTREETPVTSDTADQTDPHVYGGHLVWVDHRVESGQDIFYMDPFDQTEVQLTTTAEPYNEAAPVIHGNYALWYQGFRWYYDAYSISEDTRFTIGRTGPGDGGYGISGDRAVLTGYGGTDPSDLYLCDLSALSDSECEQLFHEEGRASNPDIDGDLVVWQDDRNGNADIFLYDIGRESERQLTSDPAEQREPKISGKYITWVDTRNGNDDIYLYNIKNRKEYQVTADTSDQRNPAIFGDYLVWEDNRNGNWDIYMYKIKGRKFARKS